MATSSSKTNEEQQKEEEESAGLLGYNNDVKKARLNTTLTTLLNDPILSDVPKNNLTLSDVDTLISFELGSAMRISFHKLDNTCLDILMINSAKVKDLKEAIKRKVNELEEFKMGHRHISWKHVWTNFCLSYHNEKLLDNDRALQDYGIRNNSQVHFIPYLIVKDFRKHSKRKKHRFFHGLNKRA